MLILWILQHARHISHPRLDVYVMPCEKHDYIHNNARKGSGSITDIEVLNEI